MKMIGLMVMSVMLGVSWAMASGDPVVVESKSRDLNLFHLDFPGSLWGRFDQRMTASNNSSGQTRFGRGMLSVEQGIQPQAFPHVVAYAAGNVYQPFAQPTDSYLSLGVKNTTLLPYLLNPVVNKLGIKGMHGQLGVEHQDSSVFNVNTPVASRIVGFASVYMEWGGGAH